MVLRYTNGYLNRKNMKKSIQLYSVLFVFLGSLLGLQAQTQVLKGTVMDRQSRMGIEGVMVSTPEGTDFTLTNSEGDFVLEVSEQVASVWFSQINYEVKAVSTQAAMLIELEARSNELEEIIVLTKPLKTVFGSALERVTQAVEQGDRYQTYVRAFNLINDDLSNVADGLVDFYIENPKKHPVINVKQNRVLTAKTEVSSEDNLDEMLNVIGAEGLRYAIGDKQRVRDLQTILKREKDYEYVIKKQKGIRGEETIVVEFHPKENLKGWQYYKGHMVFTADQEYLLSYRYALAESYKHKRVELPMIFARMFFQDMEYRGIYRKYLEDYQLSYVAIYSNIDLRSKLLGNNNIVILEELVVNNISKNETLPPKLEKELNLFGRQSNYQTEFWKNRNIRLLTAREQNTLKTLEMVQQTN